MTKPKTNPETEGQTKTEELISLAVAVDNLGIIDDKKFYVLKKYWKEDQKTLSNWSVFFTKLKLV